MLLNNLNSQQKFLNEVFKSLPLVAEKKQDSDIIVYTVIMVPVFPFSASPIFSTEVMTVFFPPAIK